MYDEGEGVAKDNVKAIEWYKKAAKQGVEISIERLRELEVY